MRAVWAVGLAALAVLIGSCGMPVRVGVEHIRAPQRVVTAPQAAVSQPRVFTSAPAARTVSTRASAQAGAGVVATAAASAPAAAPPPAPAVASSAAAARVVTLPKVPQPAGPADIVGVRLDATGSIRREIVTFGQVFARGQVPRGSAIVAHAAAGELPTQIDVKTTHPDGSARMAVVTVHAPGPSDIMLRRTAPRAAGALVSLGDLKGRYDLRVALTIHGDAGPTSHDFGIAALLERALLGGQLSFWLHGPLATEARIEVLVIGSMRLVADIRALADGSVLTDLQFNNDIAMQPVGGTLLYDVSIIAQGKTVLAEKDIRQFQYQTWHREVWSGGAPSMNIVRDTAALARAGAVQNYDWETGVDAAAIERMATAIRGPGFGILGNARLTRYMPTTGGREDIGPTTWANTIWLMTQHPDAARYALAQADAAGSVPWHFYDRDAGTYLNPVRYPKLWIDGRGGRWGSIGLTQMPGDSGWSPDNAHQPDLSYVPYILTGSRYRYDQLEAQAIFTILGQAPWYRGDGKAIVVNAANQVRSSAWSYRVLDHVAFIAPDTAPLRGFFQDAVRNCMDYLKAEAEWRTIGEVYGAFGGDLRAFPNGGGGTAPWQQDFLAGSLALSATRGVEGARELAAWMSNFVAGRFLSADKGFRPHNATVWGMVLYPKTAREPYLTWREVEATNISRQMMTDGPEFANSSRGTMQIARAALAGIVTATGLPRARQALDWVNTHLPGIDAALYRRDPTWNIVPIPGWSPPGG
jgi:hypothetical protein